MKRRHVLAALAAAPLAAVRWAHAATRVQVYKTDSCECCTGWVKHLEAAGFAVDVTPTENTGEVRRRLKMPDRFGACHTATVESYVLEGHVPAADVKRLLQQRPAAIGLAVPAMPVGSPGMEYGGRLDPYDVLLIDRKGRESVFASYGKSAASTTRR
jgi:hypothetical protein